MSATRSSTPWLLAAMLTLATALHASAQDKPAGASKSAPRSGGGLLPGATSKEPVSIDAGKLDYFDKESKLVYSGDVVAKQGESTLRTSVLTIFLTKSPKPADDKDTPAEPASPASSSSIRSMDAKGPVTVVNKDEVGTGDNGSYDKAANQITLTGHVTLTQATNVIKGDKLVYDMTSGQAHVSSGPTTGRVISVFTPGSGGAPGAASGKKPAPAGRKPAAATP